MLINFNHLKTFYNALLHKVKGFRGNWNQNDPTADNYIENRTHYIDDKGNVHKLDKKFIDMPDGIITEDNLYDNLENNLAPVAFTNNYDSLSGKPTIYTDVIRYNNSQSLSSSQKLTAKGNINAVGYDTQTLTDAQKLQARNNIGAGTSDFSGNYFDLENKPCAKTILADEVILVDYAVPFDEYVYGRALGKAPLEPTSDYKYRVIIGETTYYPSVTRYSSGSALGNKSLINSTITPEDSGEPFFFTFLPNATHTFNVEIYYDENVLNTPANVQVIQEMKVEYSLLEDGYIPDTIARTTDIITTCTYSWDGDVTGKESFVIPVNNVDSVPTVTYYKISDKYFNVADIVSSEVLAASLTTDTSIHEEGFYCSEGVLVADAAGYNTSIGPSSSFPAYIPSPGIYFYTYLPPSSGEQRKGIESATITYKAPMLSSAVVGITRTINGVSPDVEGNIEIPTPVQPNLEQNDETAPDYVKGRTHYLDETLVVIAEEHEVKNRGSILTHDPQYARSSSSQQLSSNHIIEGDEYIITVDGVDYRTVAVKNEDGSRYLFGTGGNFYSVPVNIVAPSRSNMQCTVTYQDSNPHLIKLTRIISRSKKLDERLISDDVARKSDLVTVTNDSGACCIKNDIFILSFDERIPDNFRQNDSTLQAAFLPNAKHIGQNGLRNCSKMIYLHAPMLETVGDSAFLDDKKLTKLTLPSLKSTAHDMLGRCYGLEYVEFGCLANIAITTFAFAQSLKTVVIRSDLVCVLEDVSAFNQCFHFYGTTNSTYNPDGLKDGYFYVPRSLVDSYKSANNWSTFADQFRALEDYTVDGTITGAFDETKI